MATGKKKVEAAPAEDAPQWHIEDAETQKYGTVIEDMPHFLDASVRQDMVTKLNQLLADEITLRDMYKKHHWQISGPTFYELHILFDKHFEEQVELVDTIAERIQILGGGERRNGRRRCKALPDSRTSDRARGCADADIAFAAGA